MGIRDTLKRTFSNKDPEPDFDADDADDDTNQYINKEVDDAEKDPETYHKKTTLLNRMIEHGNKKTDAQIEKDRQEYEARMAAQKGSTVAQR